MTGSRLLVTYASRYGSTGEIAEVVGEVLRVAGIPVDVIPMGGQIDLSPYRGVIIGSPVYMGKMLKETVTFVIEEQASLRKVPVVFFLVAYSLKDQIPEHVRNAEFALHVIRTYIDPVDVGLFAGKVDPDIMSGPDREVIRLGNVVPGDYHDWDGINKWAWKIAGTFG